MTDSTATPTSTRGPGRAAKRAARATPARSDEDYAFTPAHELIAELAQGTIASRDLTELYLARIKRHDVGLNAVVTVDAERARAQADEADRRRRDGEPLGALHGLPITLKDSYETAGMRSTCGRADLAHHIPTQDAEAVARLRRAGAVIVGKTNMPAGNQDVQAQNRLFGATNNPWDHRRTSGGSAGGGAAAVAAGLIALDVASEIGGSTRIPAHYTGLYGHKVTFRSIPLIGHLPPGPGVGRWSEPDLACAGAQARDPRDFIPFLEAATGALARNGGFSYRLAEPRATTLADFRVAVWMDDHASPIDEEVHEAMNRAITVLQAAGARVDVEPVSLPTTLAETHRVFQSLLFGQLSTDRTDLNASTLSSMLLRAAQNPRGDAARAIRGTLQSHTAWLAADAEREELRERWTSFFDDYDVVLMPVTGTAAPEHHGKAVDKFGRPYRVDGRPRPYWDQIKWCGVANIAGTPSTAIPAGLGARSGLPIGVQAMGPAGGDLTTITFAQLLGPALGGFTPPPAYR